jgi:hypothetical protein
VKHLWLRLRGAEDPTVALLTWVMFLVGAGVFVWSIVDGNDKIRDAGLAALGGILLLLTAYFTARNLQINARTAFNDHLMRASELLSQSDPVKQAAAREILHRMKRRTRSKVDQGAMDAVLGAADTASTS